MKTKPFFVAAVIAIVVPALQIAHAGTGRPTQGDAETTLPAHPPTDQTVTRPPGEAEESDRDLEFMSLYGDSLAYSAQDDYEYLNRRRVTYLATPMYTIDDWVSDINRTPRNNVVVLALGTNDAHRSPPPFETWIKMLDRLRGNCVVWVKPYEIVDVPDSPVPEFNDQLEAILQSSYPNVLIYDWNSRVLPEYLISDHLHYNQLGQTAYAAALLEARDLC